MLTPLNGVFLHYYLSKRGYKKAPMKGALVNGKQ